jgi:hypothetical protein
MKRTLALSFALFLLAGCGGGGGSGSVPASSQAPVKTTQGSVTISIPVESAATQASTRNARYPQFVSPAASSVSLSINGGTSTIFDVSTTSSLCTTVAGARNCTLSFAAPLGSDHFAFVIFAGPGGSGNTLASASTNQTIVAGQAFAFTLAMNAVIGVVTANLVGNNNGGCPDAPQNGNNNNLVNEGCSGSGTVTFTASDPSGAVITGPAAFASGITIAANDPSISAVPAQITAPGQTSVLSYTGAAFGSGITTSIAITLTIGTQVIPFTLPVMRSYLYVAHTNSPVGTPPTGGGNITVYTYGASGGTPPVRTISGATSGITTPIKPLVDTNGTLYVLDNNIPVSTAFNPTIRVFAPGANGSVAPIRQITNIGGVSGNQACSDMIFDPTGQFLFVSCGQVFVFPASANTTATSAVVASFNGSPVTASGLAFDLSGNLYVADQASNGIFINSGPLPTAGGFQPVTFGGSMDGGTAWSGSVMPFFLTVDNAGTLYAPVWFQNATFGAADAQAELAIWRGGNICNNCNPSAFLTGSPFTTHAVDGIVLDSAGNVYVDNLFTNVVTVFSPATIAGASLGTTGAVARTLNNTGVPGSAGMAIGP